ncbi:MAG TPA: hypothetical protein PLC48_14700, partial [Ferruginibacter sp.]|nr:hypothetical protein [Ferruginibacter sp.]
MKKFIALSACVVFLYVVLPIHSHAQAYINYSLQDSSSNYNDKLQVVNGEAYVLQSVGLFGFGGAILKKYAVDGSLSYSRDILLESSVSIRAMKVINDEVYLLGGKPTNIGCCGTSLQAIKVLSDGTIAYSRIISDTTSTSITNPDSDVFPEIIIIGNEWLISASVTNLDFPTTMGGLVQNRQNFFLLKLNANTGETIQSMAIPVIYPISFGYYASRIIVENGFLYMAISTIYNDLPITIGNLPDQQGNSSHVYVRKLNLSDFSTIFSRYVSVNTSAGVTDFTVKNGEYHITGTLPNQSVYYTKLYADGSMAFTKNLDLPSLLISPDRIKVTPNHVYIFGTTTTLNLQYSIFAFKLNLDGSTVYVKNNPTTLNWGPSYKIPIEVVGEDLYMAGTGAAANYPITNNSTYIGQFTGFVTHYDPSGNMVFSSFINPVYKMEIQNNKIYLAGSARLPANLSTDSSLIKGTSDGFITVFKPNGNIVYNGYFGGNQWEDIWDFDVDDGSVFVIGTTASPDFLTTEPVILQNPGYGDAFLTKISFCPDRYNTTSDTLSPASQTVCKYGLAQIIVGNDIIVPGDSLPQVFANAVPALQRPVKDIHYQWQKSLSLSGPWVNIQDATGRDFRPVIGTVNEYFRRQSFLSSECNAALIHTSDIATVIAGALTAPIIDFVSPIVTCPSSSIQLDGNTAITGGQAPFTYSWDMGLPSIADPVVSPSVNTVYTLLLTDMAGCQQLGQVVVSVYKANAGADKSNCGNLPVRIGTAPLPATSSISYQWTPAPGLDNSNIAQPMANPVSTTDYILTVNLTKPGGSICITRDTVRITPVAAPSNPQIAGTDKVICTRDSIMIGTPAEPGFTYSWAPANYITKSDTSQTYYYANVPVDQMPYPDPAILYVYAKKDGCIFSDTVIVTTIAANTGGDLCRRGTIGLPDQTPTIPELYSWTLVSGPGNFLGPTNMPEVAVSASVGGISTYELTVSYNGKTCQGYSLVLESCPALVCNILVDPSDSCLDFAANGGHVTLRGFSSIPDGIYTWEPQVGLSSYTGNTVQLTDNVPRTYTLTVVSAHDSSVSCSALVTTNPGLQPPIFSSPDTTTCANVPVMIGAPAQPGNTYEWTGDGLSDYHISNPVATVTYTSFFYVTITNSHGCELQDTILVTVPNSFANAGEDRLVCGNAIVTLGTDSLP